MCFFFKQKTAYELRISDWSSDVCSSDLHGGPESRGWSGYLQELLRQLALAAGINVRDSAILGIVEAGDVEVEPSDLHAHRDLMIVVPRVPKRRLACLAPQLARSEARRVGKECVSTCRPRGAPYHLK